MIITLSSPMITPELGSPSAVKAQRPRPTSVKLMVLSVMSPCEAKALAMRTAPFFNGQVRTAVLCWKDDPRHPFALSCHRDDDPGHRRDAVGDGPGDDLPLRACRSVGRRGQRRGQYAAGRLVYAQSAVAWAVVLCRALGGGAAAVGGLA